MIDSIVFGFGYRARSGKGTAVDEIVKQRGLNAPECINPDVCGCMKERYDIRKYSFANALRSEVNALLTRSGGAVSLLVTNRPTHLMQANGNFIELPDWVVLEENPEVNDQYPFGKHRTLYQWYGTEYRRSIDEDYWVRQAQQVVELEKPQIAIFDDLRFPNEMQFVLEYGEAIRVDRPGLPPSVHISETALDCMSDEDFSIILENSGTLEEFKEGAVVTFDELMTNFPFGCNKVNEVVSA